MIKIEKFIILFFCLLILIGEIIYMGMEIYLTQASLGDCILIRCGESEKKVNILIDSGLASKNFQRPMDIIHDHGEKIDMCVFTHDDNDHIQGAKNLINQIIKSNR